MEEKVACGEKWGPLKKACAMFPRPLGELLRMEAPLQAANWANPVSGYFSPLQSLCLWPVRLRLASRRLLLVTTKCSTGHFVHRTAAEHSAFSPWGTATME